MSKFGEVQPKKNTETINFLARRPVVRNVSRIEEIRLNDSEKLKDDGELFVYGKFTVDETGYYNINNQCCVRPENKMEIKTFQYGVCDKEQKEFSKSCNSYQLNTVIDDVLCYNYTTFKHLEKDKEYIVWMLATSKTTLCNLTYVNDFSHLILIKI